MAASNRPFSKLRQPGFHHQTPGWAAFDRSQRAQDGTLNHACLDPFPPVLGASSSAVVMDCSWPPVAKSFSSVVSSSAAGEPPPAKPPLSASKLLKEVHGWADDGLIADMLAAVGGDIEQVSAVLKSMLVPEPSEHACSDDVEEKVETEEEEDDIYRSHRKDAIKLMREAEHHSRASRHAFSSGNHTAARELSVKAQEVRQAANELNAKAAAEIFRIKNKAHDMWTVDLHGLHASEAVEALREHLFKLERQLSEGRQARHEAGLQPLQSNKPASARPRQNVLHVITGVGKHSKGATLPAAIRGFLIEERYRYEDARPGVFEVHPKFRCRSA